MDEIIDRVLTHLRRKALDGYELYCSQSSHFEAESKNGKVDHLETSQAWGMAIRIFNRQRLGFSYVTAPDPLWIEKGIEDAIAASTAAFPDPCWDLAPAIEGSPPALPIYDETLTGISERSKIEKAKSIEAAARSVDPTRIKKVRRAAYRETLSQRTLINSNGLNVCYGASFTSVSVTVVAEDSGASEVGWDFDASHFVKDLNVDGTGLSAGRKALERLGGRNIPSGVYPILLQRRVASEFLSLLAHSFLAEQVHKGKSPLKDKAGQTFFSPVLTVMDDGLLPNGMASSPVDGEGMPSRSTCLVDKGNLQGYLYDRYWANRENVSLSGTRRASTGNSRRSSIKAPPVMGTSNLFIEPGMPTFDDLLKELRRGMVIEEVMGLHTVDPISGDFSLGCSGSWIEGGERIHPVKSIAIAGNLFALFKNVVKVGSDLRFYGGIGSPSLLINELEISGQ